MKFNDKILIQQREVTKYVKPQKSYTFGKTC